MTMMTRTTPIIIIICSTIIIKYEIFYTQLGNLAFKITRVSQFGNDTSEHSYVHFTTSHRPDRQRRIPGMIPADKDKIMEKYT